MEKITRKVTYDPVTEEPTEWETVENDKEKIIKMNGKIVQRKNK